MAVRFSIVSLLAAASLYGCYSAEPIAGAWSAKFERVSGIVYSWMFAPSGAFEAHMVVGKVRSDQWGTYALKGAALTLAVTKNENTRSNGSVHELKPYTETLAIAFSDDDHFSALEAHDNEQLLFTRK